MRYLIQRHLAEHAQFEHASFMSKFSAVCGKLKSIFAQKKSSLFFLYAVSCSSQKKRIRKTITIGQENCNWCISTGKLGQQVQTKPIMFLLIIVFGLHSNTKLNKYVYVCLGLKYCSYRQKCKNRKQNTKQTKPRCVLHAVKFPSPGDGYRPRQVYKKCVVPHAGVTGQSINHTALLRLTKWKR